MGYSIVGQRKALPYAAPPVRVRTAQPARGGGAGGSLWEPQPGPQAAAFVCEADQIGYGGAPGGGKTDLALGLAGLKHRKSIIFRRVFPRVRDVIERSRDIFARNESRAKDSFNEQLHIWRLIDGRTIEFGALQYETDKNGFRGRAYDLHVFDEATEFTESQVRYVIGWNRSADPAQRCQVLLTFNPPTEDGQEWVIRFFAPWLQEGHPDPAADGEIRYVAMVDGAEQFYRSREDAPARNADGSETGVKARTFFHARLSDNPILAATDYGATLNSLPEPLRSILLGNFKAERGVNPWQIVPSDWIAKARQRWSADGQRGPCSGAGLDVARGGADQTTKATIYGQWVAPILAVPGAATDTGGKAAAVVMDEAQGGVPVGVDIIGIGASAYDHLYGLGYKNVIGFNASAKAEDRDGVMFLDKTKKIRFRNLRAAMWWKLREALDPDGPSPLALPPDDTLAADLKAPTWELTSGGILVEDKDDIRQRLGRSPDRADAVGMAYIAPLLASKRSNSAVGAFG